MGRLFFPFLLLLLLASATFWLQHHQKATLGPPGMPVLVLIDPGHGGYDPGVLSDGLREADITLAIAQYLKDALEQRGVSVAITRETDIDFAPPGTRGRESKRADLRRRVEIAEELQAQVFVSLHTNVSNLATRGGAEVFYYEETPGAKELAESVQAELHEIPGMSKRDAKPGKYYVLRSQTIPSLIVECGYLNIPDDRQRLTSKESQRQLANAIADGLVKKLKQR
jgi:N-acetylmuramoyl-L-alanine amidase